MRFPVLLNSFSQIYCQVNFAVEAPFYRAQKKVSGVVTAGSVKKVLLNKDLRMNGTGIDRKCIKVCCCMYCLGIIESPLFVHLCLMKVVIKAY